MIVKCKRIRNLNKYIDEKRYKDIKTIGVKLTDINKAKECGFSAECKIGEVVLPKAIGSITKFNANGKYYINKEKKELRAITRPYHIKDWHGNYHYGIAYETRQCYERKFVEPYLYELEVVEIDKIKYIVPTELPSTMEKIRFIINMFLEVFGECEIKFDNEPINYGKLIRLNWKILPRGEYPWDKLYPYVKNRLNRTDSNVVERNIKIITDYTPSFVAVGEAGFYGYIIFGFKNTNKVILESMQINNATYILDKNWRDISKLTKGEILSNNLQERRIIHSNNWENDIRRVIDEML